MLVLDGLRMGRDIPLNQTTPWPSASSRFWPLMVTRVPVGPLVGLIPLTEGVGSTVKGIPLLDSPATVTTRLPVVAGRGR